MTDYAGVTLALQSTLEDQIRALHVSESQRADTATDITEAALGLTFDARTRTLVEQVYVEGISSGRIELAIDLVRRVFDEDYNPGHIIVDDDAQQTINITELQAQVGSLEDKIYVHPRDFGAVGDGVTDDTAALQAFFLDCQTTDRGTAFWAGTFAVQPDVLEYNHGNTKSFIGRLNVVPLSAGARMLWLHGNVTCYFEQALSTGPGGATFANRTVQVGLDYQDNQRCTFPKVHMPNFAYAGVRIRDASGNDTLSSFGDIKAPNCGSSKGATSSVQFAWSNPVRAGSSGDDAQTVTVDITVLPPSWILDGTYGTIGTILPLYVWLGDRVHHVNSIDTVGMKLTARIWTDSTVLSGTGEYIFGGAVIMSGNDTNICRIGSIDGDNCGMALHAGSLYPPFATCVNASDCGIGLSIGGEIGGHSNIGLTVQNFYPESSNRADIVYRSTASDAANMSVIGSAYELHISKVYHVLQPRNTDNTYNKTNSTIPGLLYYRRRLYTREKDGYNGANSGTVSFVLNGANAQLPLVRDSGTINIQPLDLDINRGFGHDSGWITVKGSGTGGAPTGTITFGVPSGWTLNSGSSSVSFAATTHDGPAQFFCQFNIAALDLSVTRLGRAVLTATVTYDPPSLAISTMDTPQTITVTGALPGMRAQATFSNPLQGVQLMAEVTAANTVTFTFYNPAGNTTRDLASGTVRVFVSPLLP